MKINFLILLFLSLPAHSANLCQKASSAKEVDLRSEMGPLRNQGGLGWCYGFVASDLMTHYRLKKKQISKVTPESMVSAVGVSAKYNQDFFRYFSPNDELVKKQKELDENNKQKLAAEREKSNRLNHPNLYKARDYILSLNPFNKNAEHAEKKPSPSPSVTVVNGATPAAPKSKPFKEGDLIPWGQISIDYTLGMPLTYENSRRLKSAKDFASVFGMYEKTSNEMNAAEYRKRGIDVVPSSGYIFAAIDSSKNGFCTEGEARSGDVSLEQFNLKQMLETIYDSALKSEAVSCSALLNIHKMVPALDLKNIFNVLTHANQVNAYEILINNACNRKLSNSSDGPVVEGMSLSYDVSKEPIITGAQIELLKLMDKVLDNGTPVGINYYNDFLTMPNGESKKPHASAIVGKRINPDTCEDEYILRNSYGAGCAYYQKPDNDYIACISQASNEKNDKLKNKKKSECDRKKTPAYLNPKISCEEGSGYLFVSKSELGKHIFGVTYLKE